jgi:DNA-binding MarR family transcriptional regulator
MTPPAAAARLAALEREVYTALLRAADALQADFARTLEPVELTPTQYQVLHALRAAGPAGLPAGAVGGRLVAREPDVTRLLDRLDRRGLVRRARDDEDRRVVRVQLTAEGLRLVNSLDRLLADVHARRLESLGEQRLGVLLGMLEEVVRGE